VVCRAFRKPIPNQRPLGYEPWQNQLYHVESSNNYSSSVTMNTSHHIGASSSSHNLNQMLMSNNHYNPNNTSSSMHQYGNIELPQLDSPSLSPSLGTNKDQNESFEQEEEKSFNCVDWRTLDTLLETQVIHPHNPNILMFETQSYNPAPSFPSMHQSYNEVEANIHHSLGCFPDS